MAIAVLVFVSPVDAVCYLRRRGNASPCSSFRHVHVTRPPQQPLGANIRPPLIGPVPPGIERNSAGQRARALQRPPKLSEFFGFVACLPSGLFLTVRVSREILPPPDFSPVNDNLSSRPRRLSRLAFCPRPRFSFLVPDVSSKPRRRPPWRPPWRRARPGACRPFSPFACPSVLGPPL